MVGDPRAGADDEDDVERADRQQPDGEPDDAAARGDDDATECGAGETEGDRAAPWQVVDEPADRRGGKPADLGDGEGDAELGDGDIEAVGDDGEERPDVAEQGVDAQPGGRDRGDVAADRLGKGVVQRPSEHPRRRYSPAMDVKTLHQRTVESWLRFLDGVGDDQWDLPTPCTEWDVRALVNHVVGEERWTRPLLEGMTIAEVGDRFDGDLLGDDPRAAGRAAAAEAVAAVDGLLAGIDSGAPLLRRRGPGRVRAPTQRRPPDPWLGSRCGDRAGPNPGRRAGRRGGRLVRRP